MTATTPTTRRPVRRHLGTALAVLALACALAALTWARPHRLFDGPTEFVVVAGTSMKPGLSPGDLVLVHRADRYRVGDVVAYEIPAGERGAGHRVIHRIVGGSATRGWLTQGDNRRQRDPWRVPNENVIGTQRLRVPLYRQVNDVVPARIVLAGLVGLAVTLAAWPAREPGSTREPGRRRAPGATREPADAGDRRAPVPVRA